MQETKRQKQVASVIEQDLNEIFQRLGISMIHGGMVSIASVKITPDLFDAKVFLSFFKIDDTQAALKAIQEKDWEIKRELTARVRHQLRSMPRLTYYIDDTLDYVDKMETIFKDIKASDEKLNEELGKNPTEDNSKD